MAKTEASVERVRRLRDKLRAAGLRPVQIWLPDTQSAEFAEDCARQSRLIREYERENAVSDARSEAGDWFAASDRTGWTA